MRRERKARGCEAGAQKHAAECDSRTNAERTRSVPARSRAFVSSARARSGSSFSNSSLAAASQMFSESGCARLAILRISRDPGMSPCVRANTHSAKHEGKSRVQINEEGAKTAIIRRLARKRIKKSRKAVSVGSASAMQINLLAFPSHARTNSKPQACSARK